MKFLENINLSRLSNLEFGQHTKSVVKNIFLLGDGVSFITDPVLISYLNRMNEGILVYDKAQVYVAKSDETAKIVAADKERDTAVTAAFRYLSVFELSPLENEKLAFASLDTLFTAYRGIQSWNFEEESNGLDNLLAELSSSKYAAHVATINMSGFVERIRVGNENFKTIFAKRTLENSTKEVYDMKTIRADIKTIYTDMSDYVLSMAKAMNTDQFNQTLNVINAVRKYYSDLLSKRKSSKDEGTETPIPAIK
jgi:hypothetical protein